MIIQSFVLEVFRHVESKYGLVTPTSVANVANVAI